MQNARLHIQSRCCNLSQLEVSSQNSPDIRSLLIAQPHDGLEAGTPDRWHRILPVTQAQGLSSTIQINLCQSGSLKARHRSGVRLKEIYRDSRGTASCFADKHIPCTPPQILSGTQFIDQSIGILSQNIRSLCSSHCTQESHMVLIKFLTGSFKACPSE